MMDSSVAMVTAEARAAGWQTGGEWIQQDEHRGAWQRQA